MHCTVHLWQVRFSLKNRTSFLLLPVSEMALVPFMSGEGVALPTHVGFDLASKLVRHTAAGSLHGTEGVERSQE